MKTFEEFMEKELIWTDEYKHHPHIYYELYLLEISKDTSINEVLKVSSLSFNSSLWRELDRMFIYK